MAVSLRLLDTNAAIHILGESLREPPPDGPYAVSIISEIELLGYHLLDETGERNLRAFLSALQVQPLTEEIKERAIAIRKSYRLKTPDAIIAATALAMSADLISNDAQLDRVEGLTRLPLTTE
jgi:hypothetical protein